MILAIMVMVLVCKSIKNVATNRAMLFYHHQTKIWLLISYRLRNWNQKNLLKTPNTFVLVSPIQNKQAIDIQCFSLALTGSKEQTKLNRCTNSSSIPSTSNLEIVSPEMVRPFPKAPQRKMTRRGRQPGKTKILTLTPEKRNNGECLSETQSSISIPNNDDRFDDPKRPKKKLNETQSNVMKNDEI